MQPYIQGVIQKEKLKIDSLECTELYNYKSNFHDLREYQQQVWHDALLSGRCT